jgi:hypothetical protein
MVVNVASVMVQAWQGHHTSGACDTKLQVNWIRTDVYNVLFGDTLHVL